MTAGRKPLPVVHFGPSTGRDNLELSTSDFEDFLTEFLTLPTFDLIKLVNSDLFGLHPDRFS